MDIIPNLKHYLMPALISFIAISLLRTGLFVTVGDLERSLRILEATIRSEYATRQDIHDVKVMLTRLEIQLSKLEDRLNEKR